MPFILLSVDRFATCANFLLFLPARNAHDSAPDFTLVCHSEEPCDEESAFHFLIEGTVESEKQMLHGVYPEMAKGFSMTQLIPNARRIRFSWRLCVPSTSLRACFARDIPILFSCGYAALGLCGEPRFSTCTSQPLKILPTRDRYPLLRTACRGIILSPEFLFSERMSPSQALQAK
jgi:hypothetical protein